VRGSLRDGDFDCEFCLAYRIGATAEFLKQANMALQLAQTRYQLGRSSIVELSQAQLQQTTAAIV
jgi:outer membrane protein